jgi:hypothetical protein
MENNTYTYYFLFPAFAVGITPGPTCLQPATTTPGAAHKVKSSPRPGWFLQSAEYFLHPLSARVRIKNF